MSLRVEERKVFCPSGRSNHGFFGCPARSLLSGPTGLSSCRCECENTLTRETLCYVRVQILKTVSIKIMPCGVVETFRSFEATSCLQNVPLLRGYMAEYLRGGDVALPKFDRKLRDVLGSKKTCWEDLEAIKSYIPGVMMNEITLWIRND